MRTTTPEVDAAFASGNVPLLLLVKLNFASGPLYATNAGCVIGWNGYTWLPNLLGEIDAITEGATLEANGVGFGLSGISATLLATAMSEYYQGRLAQLWVAPLTDQYQVIADPVLVYVGKMDTATITMGSTAAISMTTENRFIDLDRARVRRFNSEDQAIDYPNDRGFDFVPSLVEANIKWGAA